MQNQRNETNQVTTNPHTRVVARAGARGLLFLALLLTGCGGSGGGAVPPSSPAALPPAGPQTKVLTLYHGLGFVCAVGTAGDRLWCWASEDAAITDGNAGLVGLSSTSPTIVATNCTGCIASAELHDSEIEYCTTGGSCGIFVIGNSSSTVNVYTEQVTCDIITSDSVNCPGEAVPLLSFPGDTLSRNEPRGHDIKHTPTYKNVRKTA